MLVMPFGTAGAIKDLIPPNPIVPTKGEQNLMDVVQKFQLKDIQTALDNFPVPYVVVAQAGAGPPIVTNQKAGSPKRIDADSNKATGKGGDDIQVEVNTELLPQPHLRLDITRLGGSPFAPNLKVVIAFPFRAFDSEVLPGPPNIFIGYQTTAAGGADGGYAPLTEEINFTPNVVAGTNHTFQLSMATTGADNPLRFIAGHFDGTNATGLLNADGISALVEPVPATITAGLTVNESALSIGPFGSGFDVSWNATAASKVTFDYFENETWPPAGGTPNFNTSLTFDQMPTSEDVALSLNEAAGTMTLTNTASAPIGAVTLVHTRSDGLMITGSATDVPTHVALTVGLAGTATLDVNANTLGLNLVVQKQGGFINTSNFLGYNLGYLQIGLKNVPDLTAGYIQPGDKFGVKATNPGESIGAIEFVLDDDSTLALPPEWSDPGRDIFSLVDDGTHGTAAARIVNLSEATLNLNPSPTGEAYNLVTGAPAPLSAHIQTTPTSNLIPGHDVLADCHIVNVPSGKLDFNVNLPSTFSYTTDPPQGIDDVGCTGHVDTLNFDVSIGNLPAVFAFDFDPAGHMTVKAEDGTGPNTATVGLVRVRLWDNTGPGLPSSSALFGTALRDARARVDTIPSFHATWSTGGTGTAIDFHNDSPSNFLGGAQFDVSTAFGLAPLPAAGAGAQDYGRFVDGGGSKELGAGAFGINTFTYSSNDATRNLSVHYKADSAHKLGLTYDSRFGGTFFPGYDVKAGLTVDSVPQSFDLSTNLATHFDYTASSGISSIALVGDIDITNDGDPGNSTHVDASVHGLPSSVVLDVDPGASGHANFTMASPIDSINLDVTGGEGIFGSTVKQIHLAIDHIPANWKASWNNTGGSVTAVGDHVNQISAIVSTDLPAGNDAMRSPFTTGGGAIGYSNWLRTIDDRWAQVGANSPQRETDIMSRLDDIYSSTTNLGAGEDRLLYRVDGSGDFQYLEIQLTNLQGGSFHSNGSKADASLTDPVTGDHPVYIGLGEKNGNFVTLALQNLPDSMMFDADTANPGHSHFDSNEAAGRIVLYEGPLPGPVADNQSASKVIAVSLPATMHADWNFNFPGNASFTASGLIELRYLTQDGSNRTIAVVNFQNLSLDYGLNFFPGTDVDCDITGCNTFFIIAELFANFTASPGINGMLLNYTHGSAQTANGIAASGSGEYKPQFSLLLKNLTSISGSVKVRVCIFGLKLVPCIPGLPYLDVGLSVSGDANLDYWDDGGGPFNILGDPDYVGNNPWHFYPFFYSDSSRVDPFS
ncbi:MAG TPA: hypothetical protein VF963_03565 [Gaiellaceae bacterium]